MGKGVIGLRLVEGEGSFLGQVKPCCLTNQGLVVEGIVADPAKDAGIVHRYLIVQGFQINDLVMSVNEAPLKHMSDLPSAVGTVEPGTKLKFHIRYVNYSSCVSSRFGNEMDLFLIVGVKPSLMDKPVPVSAPMAPDVKATPDRPITPPKAYDHNKGSRTTLTLPDHKKPKQQSLPEGFVNPKIKKDREKKSKDKPKKGALPAGYVNPKLSHQKEVTVDVERSVEKKEKSGPGFFASLMPGSFKGKGGGGSAASSHQRSASAQVPKAEPPPSAAPHGGSATDRPAPPPRRRSLIEKEKERIDKDSKGGKDKNKKEESKRPRTPPR